ncbi:hypothetical protein OsJ_05905 [Oryza sativa Japonica Group]|nr:hypothetical protein OsJ_05905 [Oryza sativa Japonica Group]
MTMRRPNDEGRSTGWPEKRRRMVTRRPVMRGWMTMRSLATRGCAVRRLTTWAYDKAGGNEMTSDEDANDEGARARNKAGGDDGAHNEEANKMGRCNRRLGMVGWGLGTRDNDSGMVEEDLGIG